jgi:hypothetical protein|nr:MAG TPA: hypothetical protein [Caudoviricetes sp.]
MRANAFNKLLKEKGPKKILDLFSSSEIYLTDKQIDRVLDEKNKQENWKRDYVVHEEFLKKRYGFFYKLKKKLRKIYEKIYKRFKI